VAAVSDDDMRLSLWVRGQLPMALRGDRVGWHSDKNLRQTDIDTGPPNDDEEKCPVVRFGDPC